MKIKNTIKDKMNIPLVMLLYGMGGVGKTTFASTFPRPLILDFENGSKYFGQRGISVDVAVFDKWLEKKDKIDIKNEIKNYETIIIDPIGEAMEKLINSPIFNNRKHRQADGYLTMSGWGAVKDEMRAFIKYLRDTGKNILIISHVSEFKDGENMVKRPMVATKLNDELVNMVDVVGYMYSHGDSRQIYVGSSSDKVISKDRTGKLSAIMPPDFAEFNKLINGREESEVIDYQRRGESNDEDRFSPEEEMVSNEEFLRG